VSYLAFETFGTNPDLFNLAVRFWVVEKLLAVL
jgi:hypothetical protein